MTPSEFKAWFDGFTEALDGTPSKAQWARIKARVAEIDGRAVTREVFVDRYWPLYYQSQNRPWTYMSGTAQMCGNNGNNYLSGMSSNQLSGMNYVSANAVYDSGSAMQALGRADAQTIGAT